MAYGVVWIRMSDSKEITVYIVYPSAARNTTWAVQTVENSLKLEHSL